nr:LysR family transcriptional regulator [Woeseiaceae bacterium]
MTLSSPYRDIEWFQRVVELGSIRAAALEAGVEPSSVSRMLTRLEQRLNTRLLDRARGRARATPAGMRYYEQMRSLLAQIAAVENDVAGDAELPKGLLKVNAPIGFGDRFVARWLLDFAAENPQVDVQLTLSSQFVDLRAEGIDLAVRIGRLPDSSLKASKLADVPRVLVASPDYLERNGMPANAGDLAQHDHVFFVPSNRNTPLRLRGPDGAVHEIKRRGRVTVNAIHSIVEAVEAGFGVHAGPRWAFQAS